MDMNFCDCSPELKKRMDGLGMLLDKMPSVPAGAVCLPFLLALANLATKDPSRCTAILDLPIPTLQREQWQAHLVVAAAMKKVIPQQLGGELPIEQVGRASAIFCTLALPHTIAGRRCASLFRTTSRCPRVARNANASFRVVQNPDGVVVADLICVTEISAGQFTTLDQNEAVVPVSWYSRSPTTFRQNMLAAFQANGPAGIARMIDNKASNMQHELSMQLEPPASVELRAVHLAGVPDDRLAFTIDGVFTSEECQLLLDYSNNFDNVQPHTQVLFTGPRENYRLLKECPRIADAIWHRISSACPQEWQGRKAMGLNPRVRFLRYFSGDRFLAHTDGAYEFETGPRKGQRSFVTVQVYLTGGYGEGFTRFLDPKTNTPLADVIGSPGKVLVFDHELLHEATEVKTGNKVVIRTEIMYAPLEA
eukprot:TRINITY_DN6935_c0_g1_i1.p1 TRINITY_DN6935_c0_g1~~TRINITY_DN6935_c0_g1_i1.p1  ORF type:complete len:422 (+),score=64.10 TRINITY_DN6935_c0_g1_i1:151-1416(+)